MKRLIPKQQLAWKPLEYVPEWRRPQKREEKKQEKIKVPYKAEKKKYEFHKWDEKPDEQLTAKEVVDVNNHMDEINLSNLKHGMTIIYPEMIQGVDRDVEQFFDSYLQSPGMDRIERNQYNSPKTDYLADGVSYSKFVDLRDLYREMQRDTKVIPLKINMPASASYAYIMTQPTFTFAGTQPDTIYSSIQRGPYKYWPEESYFEPYSTLGHEYFHAVDPIYQDIAFDFDTPWDQVFLDENQGASVNMHDELPWEKHADVWGLRYLLYKEGIYDSRSDKNITVDQVRQLRKKYPTLLPLLQMTDDQIVETLNNVALNDKETNPQVPIPVQGYSA